MKAYLNQLYRNHSLIYKLLLYVTTTILIVYLFPKQGKFKYNFEQGKPWQSENLYAPFDFAIQKTETEINNEKQNINENAIHYFNITPDVQLITEKAYTENFKNYISDTIERKTYKELYRSGKKLLKDIYSYGLLSENYSLNPNNTVVLLSDRVEQKRTIFSNLLPQSDLRSKIDNALQKNSLNEFKPQFTSLFYDIVKPNLTYDKNFTETALNEALKRIAVNRGSIEKETLIISKGEVVEGEKLAILNSLKKEYQSQVWTDSNYNWIVFAYILLVALALLMLMLFLRKYAPDVYDNNTKVTFVFFNVVLMVIITTLVVNYNSQYIYIVPLCILPLVLKAFFNARLGLFAHVITVLILGSIVPNSYEYMFLQIVAGIVTILTVSELYKRANLFISVGQITLVYIVAYFAFFVIHEGNIDTIKWETFLMFLLCGLATLFVQPLIYAYEKLFGLVSDVSLLELSDTNSKLLKELSNKAPGTFHHSLNVANLAEAAAYEIGANAMLARVGALYHDIGKMKNPTLFTENQATGINPHNELSPRESAEIIIMHVIDGIEIAKKYNLPDRIIDFIRTHHGTSLVYYFYMKEKSTNDNVEEFDFMYPGPKPFSKETAILMMCDSVEAASKSLKEPTSSKIDKFVETIIDKQVESGQFLNADITFKDIEAIKKVLKHKLANIYHLRIEYPE